MLAVGRGLIRGILTFPRDDHYRPSNATWVRDLCTFSGYLMGKTNKVRHTMAQIASLIAVATVFISLWPLIFTFYSQGGRWGLIRETKLPMQELELKSQGGLLHEGVYLRDSTVHVHVYVASTTVYHHG